MIILGIDPGTAILGYGIVKYQGNKFSTLASGCIINKSTVPMPEKLNVIFEGIKNKADEILANPVYTIEYIKNHEYPDESKIMIKICADIQQSECFTKMDEIYDFLYDNYKEKLISSISVFVVKR